MQFVIFFLFYGLHVGLPLLLDRARDNRGIPGGQALRGRGSALREVRHSHPCRHGEGGFNQSELTLTMRQPIKVDLRYER